MKKTPKLLILAGTVLAFLFLFGIIFYNNFIKKSIYEENSQHLLSTYEQVDKTFTMFVQHNWNALSDWSNNLQYLDDAENMKTLWYDFARRKDAWQYQDFYMFNENCDFITAAGTEMPQIYRGSFWICIKPASLLFPAILQAIPTAGSYLRFPWMFHIP